MALIQTSLIWVAYAVTVFILLAVASVFVFVYQTPKDRSASVTTVCIITTSALLATILLLPVDVALVSSTTRSSTGARKDWASQDRVDSIIFSLKVVYYILYSLDTVLCLLVCPFTYFYYEEYDERAAEEGTQTVTSRLFGALKYTLIFVALALIIFLVGFFVPVAAQKKGNHGDLDFFKDLLTENHGERALTFAIGLLISIGTLLYVLYTGAGLALLPVTLIKSAPSVSAPTFAATTQNQLEQNRERQHQLEARNQGRAEGLDPRDRRELEALVREERTLTRRERLANESTGEGQHWLMRLWTKFCAVLRPIKLLGGILIMLVTLVLWVSMLITGIDKAKNSICKTHCGYLLGHINIFQPINWIFVQTAKVFPVDYVLFLLVVLVFFSGSVVGLATVGIRFLWLILFKIQSGRTSPQALLTATVMLTLMVFAINYAIAMVVAPQYATYGPQTYCDLPTTVLGKVPDCSGKPEHIKACSELASNPASSKICTPSVVSTFINRTMLNFPFFGVIAFWAQFAFMAVFLVTFATSLFRTPKLDTNALDAQLEEDEEEGLLASTGRRFQATWQDITGRARKNNPDYGATQSSSSNA